MVEISVLVVSHVRIIRDSAVDALSSAGLHARGAGFLATAVALSEESAPQVALIDAAHEEAKLVAGRLREINPALRLVVLATREHEEDFLAWANIGISGYLESEVAAGDLAGMARRACAGEVVCPPRLAALLMGRFADRSSMGAARLSLYALTAQERKVVGCIAAGLSNKDIAERLGIKVPTVKNHVHSILAKWQVKSRGEAAAAYRIKVTDSERPHPRKRARPARAPNGASPDGMRAGPGVPVRPSVRSRSLDE